MSRSPPEESPPRRRTAVLLLAALALGGCGSDAMYPPRVEVATASLTVPLPEPAPAAMLRLPAAPAAPAAKPEPPAAPAATVPNPEALVGRPATAVSSLLGEPSFTRHDGPSAIWQYRGTGCVLDLFLFGADGPASLTVDHAELRPIPADAARPDASCFHEIVAAATGRAG